MLENLHVNHTPPFKVFYGIRFSGDVLAWYFPVTLQHLSITRCLLKQSCAISVHYQDICLYHSFSNMHLQAITTSHGKQ